MSYFDATLVAITNVQDGKSKLILLLFLALKHTKRKILNCQILNILL